MKLACLSCCDEPDPGAQPETDHEIVAVWTSLDWTPARLMKRATRASIAIAGLLALLSAGIIPFCGMGCCGPSTAKTLGASMPCCTVPTLTTPERSPARLDAPVPSPARAITPALHVIAIACPLHVPTIRHAVRIESSPPAERLAAPLLI
jgi:hypothetical protein